jgi:hypothetical protein
MSDKRNRSFNEQAYLLYYWFHEQKANLAQSQKAGNFGSKISGDKLKGGASLHKIVGNYTVSNFVPKLMSKNKRAFYKDFMDLETKKISALVPYVKLYKVDRGKMVPFYFPASAERTDIFSMLQPGASVGGVGIQDFSMSFQGKDPFMRDKNIECNLSIYLESIELLFREPPAGFAPLAELITISRNKYVPLKEGLSKEVSAEQVNRASSHEIGVDIGYSVDDVSGLFTMEERTAIKNTNLFLRLTLTNHSINVNPDGTATISASYIGRISGLLQNSNYNALLSSPDFLSLSTIFAKDKEKVQRQVNENKKKTAQESLESKIRQSTSSRLRSLFEYLEGEITSEEDMKASRIYSLPLTADKIKSYTEYVNKASTPTDGGGQKRQKPSPDSVPSATNQDKKAEGDQNKNNTVDFFESGVSIHYVYMGDLVESFVDNTRKNIVDAITAITEDPKLHPVKKTEAVRSLADSLIQLQSFKILFGEIVFPMSETKAVAVNLADVPISLSLVQKYLFNRIQQTHALKYTLNDFIEDLVGKIYPMLLSEHLYRDAPGMKVKSVVKTMMVSGENSDKLNHKNVEVNIKDLPDFLKNRNSLRKSSDDVDFMVIYSEISPEESVGMSGDVRIDSDNGVYHLNLGKDRGLLKGISFSQINQKYRKEALMLESVSLYDELKMPYNANISMFGNNMFLPGSVVYINPSSIGFGDPRNKRSSAARLGLGGYYVVTGVKTTYSRGILSTELEAVFNSWPDSDKSMTPMSTMFADSGIYDRAIDKYGSKI